MAYQELVFISIPMEELQSQFREIVRSEVIRLEKKIEPPQTTDLITRHETAQKLGVSLVTLNDWTKVGIIKGYRIGTRVRYKLHEIELAVKEINSLKHKKRV